VGDLGRGGSPQARPYDCRDRTLEQFFAAGENALRASPKDEEAATDEQIERLKNRVGELVFDIDILREANNGRPFGDVRRVRQAIPEGF
jgi:hypothetical protein